jgi:hypothetical protein
VPLVATKANASVAGYGWSSAIPESLDGMVLMKPTSIASTGTGNSSSIGTNGSVTFDTCATLSLNGVFTADYDNYQIVIRHVGSSSGQSFDFRLRVSGTDASASNYTWQTLRGDGTTVDGVRSTSQSSYRVGSVDSNLRSGLSCFIYAPFIAQPTAFRSVGAESDTSSDNARIYDTGGTHSLSTAYDGFTIYPSAGSITGLIAVYGLEN